MTNLIDTTTFYISKNQRGTRYKSLMIQIILFFIIIIIFIFSLKKQQKIASNFQRKYNLLINFINNRTKKDFMIIIHSSNKTKPRISKYLSYYYINKSYIHYFVVYGEKVQPDPKYPYLLATSCKDNTISLSGKNAYAYDYFNRNENMGDFLYRAMDDTILNITNLEKLINELRSIYDPNKHLVFRGFPNNLHQRIFLGGGTGWLMSRAFVKAHFISEFSFQHNFHFSYRHQDDTTETLILKKIGYRNMNAWDDPRWVESLDSVSSYKNLLNGKYDSLVKCPDGVELTSIRELVSMHGKSDKEREIWKLYKNFPDNFYVYRKQCHGTCLAICRSNPGIVNKRTTYQFLKDNSQFITLDDIKSKTLDPINRTNNFIPVN